MFIFSYFCPCLYLHILEIKIFIISCFTFKISSRFDSVPDFNKISAFSLLQQQRAVPHESTTAKHLTLITVAAPRMHADDVITGETASSVTQKTRVSCLGSCQSAG